MLSKSKEACKWMQEETDSDFYETDCGHTFQFFDGTPAENSFQFCPFCGQAIEVVEGGEE